MVYGRTTKADQKLHCDNLTCKLRKKGMDDKYKILRVKWAEKNKSLEIRIQDNTISPEDEGSIKMEVMPIEIYIGDSKSQNEKISCYHHLILPEIISKFPIEKYKE